MILAAVLATAFLMRVYPARYGFYLNEFDPYWDYYAANFLVERIDMRGLAGIADYYEWRDTRTWHPEGRDVATTSQVGLHFGGAFLYLFARNVLGSSLSLYDFLVLLPVFVGALTIIPVFLLTRKVGGTTAGTFAALVTAFFPPLIQRGGLGWFKSEPFALLLAITGLYLFTSVYDETVGRRGLVVRAVGAGFLLGYANTAWGGAQFLTLIVGALLFLLPFLRLDVERTFRAGVIIAIVNIFVSSTIGVPSIQGAEFVRTPPSLLLLGGVVFVLFARVWRRLPARAYFGNLLKLLVTLGFVGLGVLSFGAVGAVQLRYLTVLYPYERSGNPLVESVAEHFTPTGADYFSSFYAVLFLAGFGAFVALRRRTMPSILALVLGIAAIYIGSSFSRLLVFPSVALAILGAVGFGELAGSVLRPSLGTAVRKRRVFAGLGSGAKAGFAIFTVLLLVVPAVSTATPNWLSVSDAPVSIASGGTGFRAVVPDWIETLSWIRTNTPEDAVFASWWDYGYWIAVLGNRTSLADNATINQTRIARIGQAFISDEEEGLAILHELQADYVVVFVAGQVLSDQQGIPRYILGGGGDESKKQWFMRIGGFNETDFLEDDGFTPTTRFWAGTLIGRLFPFSVLGFLDPQAPGQALAPQYRRGLIGLHALQINYPVEGEGPLRLVFQSASLQNPISIADGRVFAAVLVYEVVD
jgi:dolichyl-diphosphooligosaccharide--protein glycosyltransferase